MNSSNIARLAALAPRPPAESGIDKETAVSTLSRYGARVMGRMALVFLGSSVLPELVMSACGSRELIPSACTNTVIAGLSLIQLLAPTVAQLALVGFMIGMLIMLVGLAFPSRRPMTVVVGAAPITYTVLAEPVKIKTGSINTEPDSVEDEEPVAVQSGPEDEVQYVDGQPIWPTRPQMPAPAVVAHPAPKSAFAKAIYKVTGPIWPIWG